MDIIVDLFSDRLNLWNEFKNGEKVIIVTFPGLVYIIFNFQGDWFVGREQGDEGILFFEKDEKFVISLFMNAEIKIENTFFKERVPIAGKIIYHGDLGRCHFQGKKIFDSNNEEINDHQKGLFLYYMIYDWESFFSP